MIVKHPGSRLIDVGHHPQTICLFSLHKIVRDGGSTCLVIFISGYFRIQIATHIYLFTNWLECNMLPRVRSHNNGRSPENHDREEDVNYCFHTHLLSSDRLTQMLQCTCTRYVMSVMVCIAFWTGVTSHIALPLPSLEKELSTVRQGEVQRQMKLN